MPSTVPQTRALNTTLPLPRPFIHPTSFQKVTELWFQFPNVTSGREPSWLSALTSQSRPGLRALPPNTTWALTATGSLGWSNRHPEMASLEPLPSLSPLLLACRPADCVQQGPSRNLESRSDSTPQQSRRPGAHGSSGAQGGPGDVPRECSRGPAEPTTPSASPHSLYEPRGPSESHGPCSQVRKSRPHQPEFEPGP